MGLTDIYKTGHFSCLKCKAGNVLTLKRFFACVHCDMIVRRSVIDSN